MSKSIFENLFSDPLNIGDLGCKMKYLNNLRGQSAINYALLVLEEL